MSFENVRRFPSRGPSTDRMFFSRRELGVILPVYGQMVAAGHCRDYDISSLRDSAVFSIFRRSSETPIYRIEKRDVGSNGKGGHVYSVIGMDGRVYRRGHDLKAVIGAFDSKRLRVVA